MGSSHDYVCSSCGYRAHVSGGSDVGFLAMVQTCTCTHCKELVDVLTHSLEDAGWEKQVLRCPECGGKDLDPWFADKPDCPKCGGRMSVDPEGLMALWD